MPELLDSLESVDQSNEWQPESREQQPLPQEPEGNAYGLTWDILRERVNQLALEREHYHGYPLPDDECELVVHPRFPLQGMNGFKLNSNDKDDSPLTETERERLGDVLAFIEGKVVNTWFSHWQGRQVVVCERADGKRRALVHPIGPGRKADMALRTIGVSRNWDYGAELKAMEKLETLLPEHLFRYYIFTGSFIERSPRSHVLYMFRRCRPTLAMSDRPHNGHEGHLRCLAAMCLHPIGYYAGTFGGAMVPTDDVIAHLMMMRGDEHHYWKCCNQHSMWTPEAGL
jgi:hypothetical protein